jgi:hypothetical protein
MADDKEWILLSNWMEQYSFASIYSRHLTPRLIRDNDGLYTDWEINLVYVMSDVAV